MFYQRRGHFVGVKFLQFLAKKNGAATQVTHMPAEQGGGTVCVWCVDQHVCTGQQLLLLLLLLVLLVLLLLVILVILVHMLVHYPTSTFGVIHETGIPIKQIFFLPKNATKSPSWVNQEHHTPAITLEPFRKSNFFGALVFVECFSI